MLDTTTASPDTRRLSILKSRLHYVDVFLDQALPRARAEDARGNLDLDIFITSCGDKGCLAFHMAKIVGLPMYPYADGIIHPTTLETVLALRKKMFGSGSAARASWMAFHNSETGLAEREDAMTTYRKELQTQISALEQISA